jgi:hypothetical protein
VRGLGKGASWLEAKHLAVLHRQDVGAVSELRREPTRLVALRLVLDQVEERVSEVRRG